MYREHRNYYNVAGVEAEEIIDKMNLLHREGAAIKYLFRCNNVLFKNESKIEDMKKCRHYINRCISFSNHIPIRDYTATYWLSKINPEVFDTDIYFAIFEIITAVGEPGANYVTCMQNALDYVNNVIENY